MSHGRWKILGPSESSDICHAAFGSWTDRQTRRSSLHTRETDRSPTRAGACQNIPPRPPRSPCLVRPQPPPKGRRPTVLFPAPGFVCLWAPRDASRTADPVPSDRADGRVIDLPFLKDSTGACSGRPKALPHHPDMHLRPGLQLHRVVRIRHHVHRRRQRPAPVPRVPHRGHRRARRHGRLHLLLRGTLPTRKQRRDFQREVRGHRLVHEHLSASSRI